MGRGLQSLVLDRELPQLLIEASQAGGLLPVLPRDLLGERPDGGGEGSHRGGELAGYLSICLECLCALGQDLRGRLRTHQPLLRVGACACSAQPPAKGEADRQDEDQGSGEGDRFHGHHASTRCGHGAVAGPRSWCRARIGRQRDND